MKNGHSEAFLKKQEMKRKGLIPLRNGFVSPFPKDENPREWMRIYMAWWRKNKPEAYEKAKMKAMVKRRAKGIKPMRYVKDMSPEELAQREQHQKAYRHVYKRLHRKKDQARANERYRTDSKFKEKTLARTVEWVKKERKTNPLFRQIVNLTTKIYVERHGKNRSEVLGKLLLEREELKKLNRQAKLKAKLGA